MSFTDFLENEILDHVLGGADYTRPASVYVGLSTTTPNDDATNITEPPGGNAYARVTLTNNATSWPAATGGLKENGVNVTFPTATGSWGTVTHFFIADAPSGGNVLMIGALTTSKTIDNGDTAQFSVGDIDVTLD